MRELGPDHHLLELREISQTLNLDLERCRELEEATKATVAFSTQHDALCRDVAKRASRKGVKDHDLYDVDDIERDEARDFEEAPGVGVRPPLRARGRWAGSGRDWARVEFRRNSARPRGQQGGFGQEKAWKRTTCAASRPCGGASPGSRAVGL